VAPHHRPRHAARHPPGTAIVGGRRRPGDDAAIAGPATGGSSTGRALADAAEVLGPAGSAGTLRWLEGAAAARIRALVEERGLRAASPLARADAAAAPPQRPPASALGLILDRDGPGALGSVVGRLADGAAIDTRVLLAHRLGPDERGWPSAEDRFASDLLLVERIEDPWLSELTRSAAGAPIPIVLGGHTLVGPGLRLLAGHP
jgi:8-oxo-dGTP pyrophosphatase MutT (NUDIX family)